MNFALVVAENNMIQIIQFGIPEEQLTYVLIVLLIKTKNYYKNICLLDLVNV